MPQAEGEGAPAWLNALHAARKAQPGSESPIGPPTTRQATKMLQLTANSAHRQHLAHKFNATQLRTVQHWRTGSQQDCWSLHEQKTLPTLPFITPALLPSLPASQQAHHHSSRVQKQSRAAAAWQPSLPTLPLHSLHSTQLQLQLQLQQWQVQVRRTHTSHTSKQCHAYCRLLQTNSSHVASPGSLRGGGASSDDYE